MAAAAVHLDEIFLSLQGEAGEAGVPALFLRLAGCPLRCTYCDTPRSWVRRPVWHRHEADGLRERPNPVAAGELAGELECVARSHGLAAAELTLAVTGGEPLEQSGFLGAWLPHWPGRVLLETAGLWPERLAGLLPAVDWLSLDWKLPRSLRAGGERTEPAACARLLAGTGVAGWVKLVVDQATHPAELEAALRELAACAPGVRTYLQPATPSGAGPGPPAPGQLLAWSLAFRDLDLDLRVQPQIHPVLGVR